MNNKVVSITERKPDAAKGIAGVIASGFSRLFSEGAQSRPTVGAYNEMIYYVPSGIIFHCGLPIKNLRPQRQFTRNAIELRCDALGLAIYASGMVQFNMDGNGDGGNFAVRVATYDHRNIKPTSVALVKTPEQLLSHLHTTLMATYNRLSREYNLAGYEREWLTLVSDKKTVIPDIPINLNNQ